LIQGIVDVKCSFWDYDYWWARSIHVELFSKTTNVENHVINDKFIPFITW
jgi:hypothetical protein